MTIMNMLREAHNVLLIPLAVIFGLVIYSTRSDMDFLADKISRLEYNQLMLKNDQKCLSYSYEIDKIPDSHEGKLELMMLLDEACTKGESDE